MNEKLFTANAGLYYLLVGRYGSGSGSGPRSKKDKGKIPSLDFAFQVREPT